MGFEKFKDFENCLNSIHQETVTDQHSFRLFLSKQSFKEFGSLIEIINISKQLVASAV